jgi:phosphatidylglycerol lysyltransferase
MDNQDEDSKQEQQPLDEVAPQSRPGTGLKTQLDMRAAAISASRAQNWAVWLVSGITFLDGIWLFASILLTRLPDYVRTFLPFGVYHFTRLLTLGIGFILIYVSFHLYQRRRVAWWVAVVASSVGIIVHVVHFHTAYSAVPQALTLSLLLAFRSRFTVKSEFRNIRFGLMLFLGSLVVALLYGTIGFWVLDRRDFGITFSLGEAIIRTLRQFLLIGNPDLVPETRQAHWFLQSLNIIGGLVGAFAVYSLFPPIVYRFIELPQERNRASAILEKYGKSTNDYFKVWSGKYYFFSPRRRSFISFRAIGGVAFCLGDPVGPEDEQEITIRSFLDFCTQNGWLAIFLVPDSISLYTKLGLSPLKVGEEAIVNLERFVSSTSGNKYFRYVRRKLEDDGYNFVRYKPTASDEVLDELQYVSNRWLTLPHHREYEFMQGVFDKEYLKKCTICTLRDKDSKMAAFINEVRSYKPGEATFDMMRHIPGLHWGVMDYLFMRTMIVLKDEGYNTFNFGVAPFVGIGKRADATLTEKAVNMLFERLDWFVHSKGLRQYKLKFEPEWKDSFVAYQGGPLGLLRIALNINRIL